MGISLTSLPYEKAALAPSIGEKTLEFHYGKHHNGYVEKLNKLIDGTELAEESLESIIKKTANDKSKISIFNNAAQVWNHTFYWQSMKPDGGGSPTGEIETKIKEDFGSYEKFVEALKETATSRFGSGWAWLVQKDGKLDIISTANADTPIVGDIKPLLTVDVWEHAYYLDYQNKRADYLEAFITNLINWDFVNSNIG